MQVNLAELVKAISRGYGIVPAHNFTHAFHSMLLMRYLYERGLSKHIDAFDLFFCSLSMLSHCIAHEEVSDSFIVRAQLTEAV